MWGNYPSPYETEYMVLELQFFFLVLDNLMYLFTYLGYYCQERKKEEGRQRKRKGQRNKRKRRKRKKVEK